MSQLSVDSVFMVSHRFDWTGRCQGEGTAFVLHGVTSRVVVMTSRVVVVTSRVFVVTSPVAVSDVKSLSDQLIGLSNFAPYFFQRLARNVDRSKSKQNLAENV